MVRNAGSRGNARFSGFIPDLLSEISKVAKFNYSLQLVSDGRYGICSETSCNGMIGEVVSQVGSILSCLNLLVFGHFRIQNLRTANTFCLVACIRFFSFFFHCILP